MAKRVLEYDPLTGITTYVDYVPETDTTIVHREQADVSLILDANKALANDESVWKQGVKNSWAHYAQIPLIVVEKWLNDYGVDIFNKDHEKKVYRLLNSPEYRYLKTTTKMHWG